MSLQVNNPIHWISTPFLESIGFAFHHFLGILICIICGKCWLPSEVLGHVHSTHDSTLQVKSLQSPLDKLVEQYHILDKPLLNYPEANQPPIQGLKIHDDGYSCTSPGCSYSCLKMTTILWHWKTMHSDQLHLVSRDKRYQHPVSVQSYFSHICN